MGSSCVKNIKIGVSKHLVTVTRTFSRLRMSCPVPKVSLCKEVDSSEYDALVWVGPDYKLAPSESIISAISSMVGVDASVATGGCVVPVSLPCGRLVFSPTGPIDRDYDDHRRFAEAVATGAKHPLLAVKGSLPNMTAEDAQLSALLGALAAVYVPLEMREGVKERATKVSGLGWAGEKKVMEEARAIEAGRVVARDIGGSDPERMAAPRVEEYVQESFKGTKVKVEVMKGQAFFEKEYPCLAAVNRCASQVPRHDGRLIWLTYEGEGTTKKTVYLVGKGI